MKTIKLSALADILKINYSQVHYLCRTYHYIGLIQHNRILYYKIKQANLVAEKLIIYSEEKLDTVLHKIYEY